MVERDYAAFIKSLMPEGHRNRDNQRPVSIWREKDRLRGFPEDTAVVIFRTRGCSWYRFSSCSMCGYFNDTSPTVTEEDLMRQVDYLANSLGGVSVLKVFTSGSFLDPPMEVPPPPVRQYFVDTVAAKLDKLLVESRTEYIREENLREIISSGGVPTRVAIGLESSSDEVIRRSVNKGSSFRKFVDAALRARSLGLEVRTYLLLKPPMMDEESAVQDCIKSVQDAAPYSNDVSVNPMNIQRNTFVEFLYSRGLYRPPRLWSVARVLLSTRKSGTQVISYPPTAGNKERGGHTTTRTVGNFFR
ncbi:archaeosine biosynthesis radical SAM protein RaSEA [Thermogymnomonas acidicola]|uniref:archaeosine biosynthesis radical SAM protein RaSEA n=1 Tax=Thermogymnomonas acidicola TaxID=399579 RepID=UPI001396B990|nr:archaeosine biosynthesis radical SAM protein RaSEA [Thermogymnomonas acidicola]